MLGALGSILTPVAAVGSLVSTIAGAGTKVAGIQQQTAANVASANYNAQVARNNQLIEEQNAQTVQQQGLAAEGAQRQKTAQLIGAEVSNAAARGIDVDSGSAVDVRSSAAETGELDALTIRSNYTNQGKNYLMQAYNYGAQSGLLNSQAGWAQQAGNIAVDSTILGGASSLMDKWLSFNQKGLLTG